MDPISFGNGYKRTNVTLSLDIFSRVEYIIQFKKLCDDTFLFNKKESIDTA